jgi:uncharacterized repeat protein (TIGR03806 family)
MNCRAVAGSLLALAALVPSARPANAVAHRPPWNNSRLVGTPEPPPPFRAVPAYPQLKPVHPVAATREPGADRILYLENYGYDELRGVLRRFEARPDVNEAEVLLELKEHVYSLTFHPGFARNRFFYIGANGPGEGGKKHTRIVRYTFDADARRVLPESRLVIIEWPSNGHNGGDCAFGNDGMLYVTSGDGTSAMDGDKVGQDLSSLRAKVLRIDVDGAPAGKPYVVPPDNPFLALPDARPETWAYGLRNPWRITNDRESGQIWVGENGQDLREYAHLLGRGENYGWSAFEGSRAFLTNRLHGPSPFTPPTIEHDHGEYRSLTGGIVYRGRAHPELAGAYLYGDYSTGRIGAARHNGRKMLWQRELTDTPLAIVGLGVDVDGEPLLVDYGGGFYRLAPNEAMANATPFPRRLSETGLFADATTQRPAAGVFAYEINTPGWHDGARGQHWVAAPAEARFHPTENGPWQFDDGFALAQTLSLNTSNGPRRVETRVLLKRENDWVGYTYVWNEAQTDAELAPATGRRMTLDLPEGRRSWLVPSRSDCLVCHSRAANFALSLTVRQLNRPRSGDPSLNQLHWLEELDLVRSGSRSNDTKFPMAIESGPRHPELADTNAPAEVRARAYLAVNCAHCHVHEGGGNSAMDLAPWTPLKNTRLIDQVPQHGTLNLKEARVVAPGAPTRSVLVSRVALRLPGQMPPLGTIRPDAEGVRLLTQWISSLRAEAP